MALLTTDRVVTWGDPSNGELGIGANSGHDVSTPTYVCAVGGCSHGELTSVKALAGDDDFSLALLDNGTVRSWGENTQGQLGDGFRTDSLVPVAVCAVGADVVSSTGGRSHSRRGDRVRGRGVRPAHQWIAARLGSQYLRGVGRCDEHGPPLVHREWQRVQSGPRSRARPKWCLRDQRGRVQRDGGGVAVSLRVAPEITTAR